MGQKEPSSHIRLTQYRNCELEIVLLLMAIKGKLNKDNFVKDTQERQEYKKFSFSHKNVYCFLLNYVMDLIMKDAVVSFVQIQKQKENIK